MDLELVKAIFYGLTRMAASAGGMYLLYQGQTYAGAALLAGSAGFTVFDKIQVKGKIADALAAPPAQGN